jgi:glycosyltransferase involved in cell wall biosynthesis
MRRVLVYRGKVARDVEICVLPQQTRLLTFLKSTGRTKPAYCVWNCPSLDEIVNLNSQRRSDCSDGNDQLIVYYHGSIAPVLLPTQLLVAAIRLKGAVKVRFAGYETLGSIGYIRELIGLASRSGSPGLIEAVGRIPRRDALRIASKSHLGVALMPSRSEDINLQHIVGASNKAFDYMACGLPLLVTESPEWVETFVAPGYARACNPDDPDSIEAALRWYLTHPNERREMGRRGRERVRQAWNYNTMFAPILRELERDDVAPSIDLR